MKFDIRKSFLKDLKKIDDKKLKEDIKSLFTLIEAISTLDEIPNLKKIKGVKGFYRVRLKGYRVGFEYKENKITFIRVLPRKDIYKFFP